MKTGNEILDKALQAQKGIGELEIVKASFYENHISYGKLVNNTVYSLINYTYINILLKDIEATYNNWNKAIGILEKIVDFSKDYYRQKLDGLKEQMYWLNDHGKQARGLDGMIKDAIIFKTGNYEDSSGAQYRIDQVYNRYNQRYKTTVEKIEKGFLDIIYGNKPKDTRPLIEKLKPIIDKFQPEQATLFTNGIKTHVKPEINLIGLEINILMQQPSNIFQSYFIEPNDEDQKMIQELMAQLELMKQEMKNINDGLINKDKIIADKDQALADKDQELQAEKDKNSDLNDKLTNEKILTKELTDKNNDLANQVENLTVKVNDLTEKLDISEEKNAVLQNKFDESQAKVRPLEEKVLDLKHYNKQLEDDKIDLRETQKDMREVQKMLIEDKKTLISEKKKLEDKELLLSLDKKHFQDLSLEQAIKITQLEQIHCNNPDHFEIVPSGDHANQHN